jgi:hypothetical protein
MAKTSSVFQISATEYEQIVKALLDDTASSEALPGYESKHLEAITGVDGTYSFDVTVRFRALGVII